MTFNVSKFKSVKTQVSGIWFASKFEALIYQQLLLQQRAGIYTEIKCQDTLHLTDARIIYKPDFKCTKPDGTFEWIEAKGFETPEWRLKLKLWKHYGPGPLVVYKGSTSKGFTIETITPKQQS